MLASKERELVLKLIISPLVKKLPIYYESIIHYRVKKCPPPDHIFGEFNMIILVIIKQLN
jgi:hypothetical protein